MKAKAVKMADGVYWVGVIHWNSRTFHGYGMGHIHGQEAGRQGSS